MINKLLISICFVFGCLIMKAQLEVNPVSSSDDVLQDLIIQELVGCNVNVTNVTYTGNEQSLGTFSYIQNDNFCQGDFGLDRGFLMTTGMIDYAQGPNNSGDDGQEWNEEYEDSFLHQYLVDFELITPSINLYDPCVLEFDITSSIATNLDFEVIFGSEEYVEWMSPYYADVFCFFVTEINGDIDPNFDLNPKNIMEIGNVLNANCDLTNKPISPWTIRPYSDVFQLPGVNECLYLDNENGVFCDAIGYDGYTTPMSFNLSLYPDANYHIKMVIIDGALDSWAGLDSGVFIKKSDFNSIPVVDFSWSEPEYNNWGALVSFINTSSYIENSSCMWDFDGDGNMDSNESNPTYIYEYPGVYNVTLEVVNNCTNSSEMITYEIVIDSNTQLEQMGKSNIIVSPNPASDYIIVSRSNYTGFSLIQLIDLSGRIRFEYQGDSNFFKIDISDFSSGLYNLTITDLNNKYSFNEKLIIL